MSTKTLLGLAAFSLSLAGFIGCSSEDAPATTAEAGPSGPLDPTFSNVFREVVLRGGGACASAQCHGVAQGGGLRLDSKATAHTALVGKVSEGLCLEGGAGEGGPGFESCGCASTGKIRVVPFEPDQSLFLEKLSGSPDCGERMPPTGEPLDADKLDLVRRWILAGALND
jgi:hypothetical protein